MHTVQRIIVATSVNEASDPVLRAADAMARRCGAELHIFHSVLPPMGYYSAGMGMTVAYPQAVDSNEKWGRLQLLEQLARVGIAEETHTLHVEVGTPHRTLLELASELDADLLVVGASESFAPTVLGSTADRVLRKATCPVLVVKGDLDLSPTRVLAPVDLSDLCEDSLRRGLQVLQQMRHGVAPQVEALFVVSPVDRDHSMQFTPEQNRPLRRRGAGAFSGTPGGNLWRYHGAGVDQRPASGRDLAAIGERTGRFGRHGHPRTQRLREAATG